MDKHQCDQRDRERKVDGKPAVKPKVHARLPVQLAALLTEAFQGVRRFVGLLGQPGFKIEEHRGCAAGMLERRTATASLAKNGAMVSRKKRRKGSASGTGALGTRVCRTFPWTLPADR